MVPASSEGLPCHHARVLGVTLVFAINKISGPLTIVSGTIDSIEQQELVLDNTCQMHVGK